MQQEEFDKKEKSKLTASETKQDGRGCVRPAIAVGGFFGFMFFGAWLTSYTRKMWIIPIAIIAMFVWAVYFSMDWRKRKNK